MQIYFAQGRDHLSKPFGLVVQAINEENAKKLVLDALKQVPILFWCEAVGNAFKGETDERIIW